MLKATVTFRLLDGTRWLITKRYDIPLRVKNRHIEAIKLTYGSSFPVSKSDSCFEYYQWTYYSEVCEILFPYPILKSNVYSRPALHWICNWLLQHDYTDSKTRGPCLQWASGINWYLERQRYTSFVIILFVSSYWIEMHVPVTFSVSPPVGRTSNHWSPAHLPVPPPTVTVDVFIRPSLDWRT